MHSLSGTPPGFVYTSIHVYVLPFSSSGRVMSVSVAQFNSSAVNVSWTPLPSVDVTSYTVYYSQLAE